MTNLFIKFALKHIGLKVKIKRVDFMLAAVVFRSEGKKLHLALPARRRRSSIVLLVSAVLLVV